MDAIKIPVGQPVTFARLRALNPGVPADEFATAFRQLPAEIQQAAWQHEQLRTALDDYHREAGK
jgi:hypothetical protein